MGYYPQESLYKPYKYHGYTVRGTLNCPLNIGLQDSPELLELQLLQLEVGKKTKNCEDAMFLCPAFANELSVIITIQND